MLNYKFANHSIHQWKWFFFGWKSSLRHIMLMVQYILRRFCCCFVLSACVDETLFIMFTKHLYWNFMAEKHAKQRKKSDKNERKILPSKRMTQPIKYSKRTRRKKYWKWIFTRWEMKRYQATGELKERVRWQKENEFFFFEEEEDTKYISEHDMRICLILSDDHHIFRVVVCCQFVFIFCFSSHFCFSHRTNELNIFLTRIKNKIKTKLNVDSSSMRDCNEICM